MLSSCAYSFLTIVELGELTLPGKYFLLYRYYKYPLTIDFLRSDSLKILLGDLLPDDI